MTVAVSGHHPESAIIFIGVSTAGSAIMRLLPRWRDLLGVPVVVEGIDLPLPCSASRYREVVSTIRSTPRILGAVITSHKVDLLAAARDLVDELDDTARRLDEVNTLSKTGGRLKGHARDAVSMAHTLRGMSPPEATPPEDVLCLGAGGAGRAVVLSLPLAGLGRFVRRLTVVDRCEDRLESFRRVVGPLCPGLDLDYHCHAEPGENDALLAAQAPHSLVVNATGMGKDRAGSPVSDRAVFPLGVTVWELNYRGSRPFLAQARAQQRTRQLGVHDGWLLFLHGWAECLATILGRRFSEETMRQLTDTSADDSVRS